MNRRRGSHPCISVLVALALFCASCSGEPARGVGEVVELESGQIKIDGLECGRDVVGRDGTVYTPAGHWCFLDLKVTNNGQDSWSVFAQMQIIRSESNERYSGAVLATSLANEAYARDAGVTEDENVDPGEVDVHRIVVFDLPLDTRMQSLSLNVIFEPSVKINWPVDQRSITEAPES